jgi:hypothetical protein
MGNTCITHSHSTSHTPYIYINILKMTQDPANIRWVPIFITRRRRTRRAHPLPTRRLQALRRRELRNAEFVANWLARPSIANFEIMSFIQGVFVEVTPMLLSHVLHVFKILKSALTQDPSLKALARTCMFKLILEAQYVSYDHVIMVLACSTCTIVQNMLMAV